MVLGQLSARYGKTQRNICFSFTGYIGRIGIFEVLPITDAIAKLILNKSDAQSIEAEAVKEGMLTMKQDGYLKVIEGISTMDEILRVAQE